VKNISTALTNFLLDNVAFNRVDLISIILPNGQIMNVLSGTNYTSIQYPIGAAAPPAVITINGASYPWTPTDPNYPFATSGGVGPASLAVVSGSITQINYTSGLVSPFFSGIDAVPPDGGSGGAGVGDAYINPAPSNLSLIGGFADAGGNLLAPPFYIGLSALVGPSPPNTTQILMGVNDNFYFNNTGSWTMNIGGGTGGSTFYSTKYGSWERGAFSNKADFKISPEVMKLIALIPESVMYPGTTTPIMQVVNQGMLTTSKVIIQTLFWPLGSPPSSGFSMGTMQLMQGQIGSVKNTGRSKIECDVYDLTYILNRPFPPHMIQSACRHTFCDAGCTLKINNFRSTPIAIDATSTNLYINLSIPARGNTTSYLYGNLIVMSNIIYMCTTEGTTAGSAPTFNSSRGALTTDGGAVWTSINNGYPQGYVVYVSGQNAGLKNTIKAQTLSTGSLQQIQVLKPFPFAVANTDTIRLITGCDKTTQMCGPTVYNNLIHFGGTPFVPNPEIAS
jgi:hypothetical protein